MEIVQILFDYGVLVIVCLENFCGCIYLYGVFNVLELFENLYVFYWLFLYIVICYFCLDVV